MDLFEDAFDIAAANMGPGDSFDNPIVTTGGTETIQSNGVEYFEFTTLGGIMEFTMTPITTTDDMVMILWNENEQALQIDNQVNGVETFSRTALTAGTYVLSVYSAQFTTSPPDGFSAEYQLTIDIPVEANNSMTTAPTLGEGVTSAFSYATDWYKISSGTGALTIDMTAGAATSGVFSDLNMVLFDSAGNPIAADTTPSGINEEINYFVREAGDFFLRVVPVNEPGALPNAFANSYDLTVDLPEIAAAVANDDFATAPTLTEGTTTQYGSYDDWFKIESPSGFLNLTLTKGAQDISTNVDLNMVLYNSLRTAIASPLSTTGSNEEISYLLSSDGDYYVRVFAADFGNPENYPDGTPSGYHLSYDLTIDVPEASTSEANDMFETATEITEGDYVGYGLNVDWLKITSPSGFLNLTLTEGPQDETTIRDLNMVLYDSEGVEIASNFAPDSGNEEIVKLLPADGDYYIKIFSAAFVDNTPNGAHLSYTLSVDAPEVQAAELNDEFETATEITEGDYVGYGTDVDWLKITSPSGFIRLTMTEGAQDPTTLSDLNMVLYNSDGVSLAMDNTSTDGNEEIVALLGADGDYYIQIKSALYPTGAPNGTHLSYNLSVELPVVDTHGGTDPGETRETAATLTAGTTDVVGRGQDWFRMSTGPGTVDITMTPTGDTPLDLNMEVYNLDGEAIASGFTTGPETLSFVSRFSQDFYVKVYWAPYQDGAPNGIDLTYSLDVDLPINTWSTELDFGPIRRASVAVYDIDNDGKEEIFVGTSKKLDEEGNEVLPAGLIVLEDDGTVKWSTTFAAYDGIDVNSGKRYNTSSISTAPIFTDLDGDGKIDILVGTGADGAAEFDAVGQPGDMGGVHAVDANGNHMWSHFTRDKFGSADLGGDVGVTETGPDGRADGVLSAPRVFDIDGDGVREVLYLAWDHYLYALDGRTGEVDFETVVHDTAGASPNVADLNGDGIYEIIAPSDISANPAAGIHTQGGILHVMNNYGQQNVPGWDNQVQDSDYSTFRGVFDEQSLWSSPQIVDLDRDGTPEIVQGTGNFFKDGRGEYIKVYNADGTLRMTLPTAGSTLANALIADLDGDGSSEIIAATTLGHVHAFTAGGVELFDTEVLPYNLSTIGGIEQDIPIPRSPIAVDLDNDGDLEIIVSVGSQMIVLDSNGDQITNLESQERTFFSYSGSPVARDIDGDGRLDLISGGGTENSDQAVVFRFENIVDVIADNYRTASYQGGQSLHEIQNFVDRFYSTILGREADAGGRNGWTDLLYTGVRSGADVARGFINSGEFIRQGNSDEDYVEVLYAAFFDRAADVGGFNAWMSQLESGASRGQVLEGFIGSREFSNLATKFGIKAQAQYGIADDSPVIIGDSSADSSILRGGASNNIIYDAGTSVTDGSDKTDLPIAGQIYRMYEAAFAREPGAAGFLGWYGALESGNQELVDIANRFVTGREFTKTYGEVEDVEFIELLYQNVLGRASDAGGRDAWLNFLADGATRAQVIVGFSESGEFVRKTNADLDKWMYTGERQWNDIIEGGAGDDIMNGGLGSDTFVFRNGQGGADTIHRFEPWDQLQLSGFGFSEESDVLARMQQSGSDVLFNFSGQQITFVNTTMAEMQRVKMNVS